MLTSADEINREIADVKATLDAIDRDIEGREGRLKSLRAHRDRKQRDLLLLEGRLAREVAPLQKPTGKCVTLTDAGGVEWKV